MPEPSNDSPHPRTALISVCMAALILPMSFSGGAVATPTIGELMGGGMAALTWITNAFMLTFGGLLMTAGALADRWGRKRMFVSGVGLFAIVSIALSLAPTLLAIDLLRALQGVGAAAALAGGSASLAQEFTGAARARAFSLLGTTFGAGLAFGPMIAGLLIHAFGWRAVFAATAAFAGLALLIGLPVLRETRSAGGGRMDWPGAATFTLSLSVLTFCIIQSPAWGWKSAPTAALLGATVIGLASFVWIERRSAAPLLDLSLFRYPRFVGVQLLPIATCYCFVVLLVLLPLRFIGVDGYGEFATGMIMLALSAPMLIAPTIAVWLARRHSAGTVSAAGLIVAGGGLLWLAQCGPGTGLTPVPAMLLIGVGAGLPWGLMDGLSIGVVPIDRAGMATGIFSTTRVAGEGIALATVAAGLAALVRQRLDAHAVGAGPVRSLIAQHLATGDVTGASRLGGSHAVLTLCYDDAFTSLTHILAGITFLSAIVVFFFLRRIDIHDT